ISVARRVCLGSVSGSRQAFSIPQHSEPNDTHCLCWSLRLAIFVGAKTLPARAAPGGCTPRTRRRANDDEIVCVQCASRPPLSHWPVEQSRIRYARFESLPLPCRITHG